LALADSLEMVDLITLESVLLMLGAGEV